MEIKTNVLNRISYFFVILVFILYSWAVFRYTVNMPYWDDYYAVLNFLNNFHTADLSEKIRLLFSQHNEHRILFNRLIELLQVKLFVEVNFLYLTIIGNLGWFLVIYFLWRYVKSKNISFLQFSPIIILLLSFSHYGLMTWSMASIQQYYQVLFSLIAIWFMVNNKTIYALIMLIVSVFTGGGGIILIPLFLLYALLQKNWKILFIFFLGGGITLFMFFVILGYEKPSNHPSIIETLKNPQILVTYILMFIGSVGKYKIISIVIGLVTLSFFTWKSKQTYKENPFVFWSILFILGTATIAGLSRAGFGIGQALSSRYAEYSLLLLALVYLQYLFIFKSKKTKIMEAGLAFSLIVFSLWFIVGSRMLNKHYDQRKNDISYPDKQAAERILLQSFNNGIFTTWEGVPSPSHLLNLPKPEGKK